MQSSSHFRRLGRLAIIASAFALVVVACGGGTSNLGTPDVRVDATVTSSNAAPPDDEPRASTGDDRGSELVGRWQVFDYQLPDGGLTNVVGSRAVVIEFRADGTVFYDTGCNEGTTEYETTGVYVVPKSALDDTPEGQPIAIGPSFQQTEIGCEGFLGDQDRDLPANMAMVTRFRLDEDRLLLLDEFLLIKATKVG